MMFYIPKFKEIDTFSGLVIELSTFKIVKFEGKNTLMLTNAFCRHAF